MLAPVAHMRSYVLTLPDNAHRVRLAEVLAEYRAGGINGAASVTGDELAHDIARATIAHDRRRYPKIVDLAADDRQVLSTIQADNDAADAFETAVRALGVGCRAVRATSLAATPAADRIQIYPPRVVDWCAGCGCGRHDGYDRCLQCQHDVFYSTVHNTVSLTMLDFPTGHAINRHAELDHHPDCSTAQTNGALLCDCDAVEREWERIVAAHRAATV